MTTPVKEFTNVTNVTDTKLIQDLEISPHICISVELIRHLLDPFPSMTLSGVLRLTSEGISISHSDNKTLLAEFQVSRAWFEYDFGIPDLIMDESIEYNVSVPIRFDVWLEVLKSHPGTAFLIFWPESRIIQILYPDTKVTSKLAQLRKESTPYDSVYLGKTLELFPPVSKTQYPYTAMISRNEFNHQIVLALIDPSQIYIGICANFIIFYVSGSGTIVPCETFNENHPLANQGYVPGGKNTHSHDTNQTLNTSISSMNPKKTKMILIPGHENTPLVVQSHSIRNLSIIARSRYGCDKLIIGFSLNGSVIVSYPIKPYGCAKVDKDAILQETAYFRYTLLANEKEHQDLIEEPPSDVMTDLIRQLENSSTTITTKKIKTGLVLKKK